MSEQIEKTRLLIRVAGKLQGPDAEHDRGLLLAWADELLTSDAGGPNGPSAHVPDPSKNSVTFPLPISVIHKRTRYEADLLDDWGVKMKGNFYKSPSGAGFVITGYQVNGWRFWRYEDPETGRVKQIDGLRRR